MTTKQSLTVNGVNQKSGNIHHDGSVIVNGNVEKDCQIIAHGDVRVTGFVDSALIKASNDIFIRDSATGDMSERNCQLIADGNISFHHGQGLNIVCGKKLQVNEQLAYSQVTCRGETIIGASAADTGAFFASTLKAEDSVTVKVAGALSGSQLLIDFSDAYNAINHRLLSLTELRQDLKKNNAAHLDLFQKISTSVLPKHYFSKIVELDDALDKENKLLHWVTAAIEEQKQKLVTFIQRAKLNANQELFPGVTLAINEHVWSTDEEHLGSMVEFIGGRWQRSSTSI